MASQAMYCLSVQIGSHEDDLTNDIDTKTIADKTSVCETAFPMSSSNKESTTNISQTHPNNIILLRGARSDNGHIILHNNQDLMSLISDEEKHVLIQHQRLKTKKAEGALVLQPSTPSKSNDETILLQPTNLKKNTGTSHLSEGQFLIQHRVGTRGLSDGPILLQTLKRLEKSQSIFLFRNNNTAVTSSVRISSKKSSPNPTNSIKVNQVKQKQQKEGTSEEEIVKLEPVNHKHLPLGNDGEPIKLPENLESLPRADHFPTQRHRWNTNEEIAAILINFERHSEWQSKEVKTRPKSGAMLLYSRKKVRYRRDGYCWKKRKDGKTTREDHMKLKVQGTECIYGCYVHSAILPTFHRRCYWLLQNPDIVLVHYLNVPYPDDNKMAVIAPSLALWGDKKEWTKEELVSQLKPMFFSEDEPDTTNDIELSTAETVESIVVQLMEKQRAARQAALVKQLECGCSNSNCTDGKSCSHPMRRIPVVKNGNDKRLDNCNQWNDRWKNHGQMSEVDSSKSLNNQIHYQVRDSSSNISSSMTMAVNTSNHSVKPKSNTNSNVLRNSALHESPNLNEISINTHNNSNSIKRQGNHNLLNLANRIVTISTSHNIIPNHRSVSIVSQSNNGTAMNTADMSIMSTNLQMERRDQHQQHLQIDNHQEHQQCSTTNLVNSTRMNTSTTTPPLVLNLSQVRADGKMSGHFFETKPCFQIQNPNGSLLILNGQQQPLVCQTQYMKGKSDKEQIIKSEMVCQKLLTNPMAPKDDVQGSAMSNAKNQSISSGSSGLVGKSDKKSENTSKDNDSLSYFNETLDLSQEDIQKTLSANMPLSNHNADETMNSDINPMDFMDNVCVGNTSSVHDDDVFVNLDAFDMLVEFPDLELDGKNNLTDSATDSSSINCDKLVANVHETKNSSNAELFEITDYSPEWAYPDGGVKILITGPWNVNCSYTVLFDSFPVPTTIVQSGVLRCFCPAHDVGYVTLQVACEGYVISNSVIFEYKSQPKVDVLCEGTNDSLYKFNLLHRLEALDTKMHIKSSLKELPDDSALLKQPNFEERLVNYCQSLSLRTWNDNLFGWHIGHKNMTLLHLASALGYSRLILTMLTWREENSSIILEAEIDALRQDDEGFTPLMWACARGHNDTAIMLYHWNHNAINLKNRFQMSALDLAKSNGFVNLTSVLERLEIDRINGKFSNALVKSLKGSDLDKFSLSFNTIPNDGFKHEYGDKLSIDKPTLSTESSLSSSRLDFDVKERQNLPNYDQISDSGSETMSKIDSETKSGNENRSHDGVFLRPVAVSSSSSPILKFAKRPSVDSGIGIDLKSSFRTFGKCAREPQKPPLSSRLDRSMSLPISSAAQHYGSFDVTDNSSLSVETSMEGSSMTLSSHNLLSPLRKMDFALCEISAGDSSPMGQQDTVQNDDENDERHLDIDSMSQEGGVVGESDAKVLTLAEQIIAAIPERIKNESDEMMSIESPLSESLSIEAPNMGVLSDNLIDPLLDSLPNSHFDQEFNFEFSDHNYRYHDVGTPCSSLSPASSGPLPSPASYSIPPDPLVNTPSPPPTTQDFTEFLQASNTTPKPFEADFSNLTLTDSEQRELYEAAKCIQKAYRSYKGRKKLEEQDKERTAAIVIQNYYRRYKQYVYYRQMTHAALIIQNGYRSYCENKRFKKAQHQNIQGTSNDNVPSSSQCLENFYKNYQSEQAQFQCSTTPKELSPSGPLKRTYSQRTQNQAARKIQQFMRQSKMNIWEDHFSNLTSERTSRKREACPPTQGGGLPPKLAVSRCSRPSMQRAKVNTTLEAAKLQNSSN